MKNSYPMSGFIFPQCLGVIMMSEVLRADRSYQQGRKEGNNKNKHIDSLLEKTGHNFINYSKWSICKTQGGIQCIKQPICQSMNPIPRNWSDQPVVVQKASNTCHLGVKPGNCPPARHAAVRPSPQGPVREFPPGEVGMQKQLPRKMDLSRCLKLP